MQKKTLNPSVPTITSGVSQNLLNANGSRSYLFIRNYLASSIAIGLNGQALSSATAPVAGGLVLLPNEWYESTDDTCPFGAITVFQNSGSSTNSILVIEA